MQKQVYSFIDNTDAVNVSDTEKEKILALKAHFITLLQMTEYQMAEEKPVYLEKKPEMKKLLMSLLFNRQIYSYRGIRAASEIENEELAEQFLTAREHTIRWLGNNDFTELEAAIKILSGIYKIKTGNMISEKEKLLVMETLINMLLIDRQKIRGLDAENNNLNINAVNNILSAA
jgi:hypothetical protein